LDKFFQPGNNSSNAVGWKQFPDSIWEPNSEPFSTTQTLNSRLYYFSNYFKRMAVDKPAGPPPTIKTSKSMLSRWIEQNRAAAILLARIEALSLIILLIQLKFMISYWKIHSLRILLENCLFNQVNCRLLNNFF